MNAQERVVLGIFNDKEYLAEGVKGANLL